MNREERLRRIAPDYLKDRAAAELAELPLSQVELIEAIARACRAEGREHEKAMRARARKSRRLDADQVSAGASRMLAGIGRRGANGDLDAAADLYRLIMRDGAALLDLAIAGLRVKGYSDAEIAAGLGVTRQAVGQRFGRKGAFTPQGGREGAA